MDSENITAYPLTWPTAWPRTPEHARQDGSFRTTFSKARDTLVLELERMGVERSTVIISSSVALRKDGLPYATTRRYDDPGVAVYFVLDGKQVCFPCDRWKLVEHNLRAIGKTIEALRGLERWGAKHMVDAAFAGFAALPEQSVSQGWWDVLGVDRNAHTVDVERAYRQKVMHYHPDRGGNVEMFHVVQEAWNQHVAEWNRRRESDRYNDGKVIA